MAQPLLHPACEGWREDLALPTEPPKTVSSLGTLKPNHLDQIYLETPRTRAIPRDSYLLMALCPILTAPALPFLLSVALTKGDDEASALIYLISIFYIWCIALCLKLSFLPPRDEPIRFNRARQKIYAYKFTYEPWNPFVRWRAVPVAYDWSQARAERWSQHSNGRMTFTVGVMLSIIRPGTTKVIDRFHLTTNAADEYAWAFICSYMQGEPCALVPAQEPDAHNDLRWYQFPYRLAPKVVWPPEMDLESRTAPDPEAAVALDKQSIQH
ncbi:DUF6708 domain-containing protein [Pseudomonas sp. NPDC089752]|uniref:DUF6708 domain-containing protein n=1 Tax=Pseudomonas sp. NPDC089752 TaxID=3364472 RepID=UPI00380734B9